MGVGTADLRKLWDDIRNARTGRLRLVREEGELGPPLEPAAPEARTPIFPLPPEYVCGPARDRSFPLPQFFTTVHGLRTAFADAGAGPAVVFVHASGGNLTHWTHVLPRLAARHRVLALDLPGSGATDRLRDRPSLHLLARHLYGLLDALGIERAAFVGHSLGGAVALELARTHPARTSRLVLLDPPGLPRPPFWLRAAGHALLHPTVLGSFLPSLWRPALDRLFARRNEYVSAFVHGLTETCGPEDVRAVAEAVAGLRGELLDRDLTGMLDEVSVPTLVAWGEQDPLVAEDRLRTVAARRSNVTVREIRDCGMLPMIERPWETAQLVAAHLAPLVARPPADVSPRRPREEPPAPPVREPPPVLREEPSAAAPRVAAEPAPRPRPSVRRIRRELL
jgi:pimeloyl-ACP methyl ester carboxylesterase